MKRVKIKLLVGFAGWSDTGRLVSAGPGDEIELSEVDARGMIGKGWAVAVDDEPKAKKPGRSDNGGKAGDEPKAKKPGRG